MAAVELKQMKGRRPKRGGGTELILHGADEVLYNGELVGQIARHADPTLCLYYKQNEKVTAEILRGVTEARAADPEGKHWLPNGKHTAPPTDEQVQEAVDVILEQEAAEEADTEEDETEE